MTRALDPRTPSTGGNSLVTDICRLFLCHRADTWLPTSTWVRALVGLSLSEPGSRTALHRMARGGYLQREKRGSAAGYAMSRRWQQLMRDLEGAEAGPPGWLLVAFTVPEEQREDRRQLRAVLARQGFAALGGGTWIGSRRKTARVRSLLQLFGLERYVDLFAGEHLGPLPTTSLAERCWDLPALAQEYTVLERSLAGPVPDDPTGAFVHLVRNGNAYRLLRERDPDLPPEALPEAWPATRIDQLMDSVVAAHRSAAEALLRG